MNNNHYYSKITQLLNDKALLNENSEFYCKIELSFNDGEHFGIYSILRQWNIINGSVSESREYYEGRRLMDEEESYDFENLLLHLIPPDLFNFYFFDGEKISSILSEDGTSNNFRNAFIKISGLDNLDLLVECFKKNSDKAMKDKKIYKDFQLSQKSYEEVKTKFEEIKDELTLVQSEISKVNDEIKRNYKNYVKSGGVSQKDLAEINSKIIHEEVERESYRKDLKEYANSGLPFVILKPFLKDFLINLKSSKNNDNVQNAQLLFQTKEAKSIALKYFTNQKDLDNFIDALNSLKSSANTKQYYKLSDTEYFKILSQIEEKLKIDSKEFISSSLFTSPGINLSFMPAPSITYPSAAAVKSSI